MPPSGYNKDQARHLSLFLLDCAHALEMEAEEEGRSLSSALDSELANIAAHLKKKDVALSQVGVLMLTQAFYEAVRRSNPKTISAYRGACSDAAEEIASEITALKVVRVSPA